MKIRFTKKDPTQVFQQFQEQLRGRKLGELVQFESVDQNIRVIIKKMGTSILEFEHQQEGDLHEWVLTTEKIALAHRAFKGEILEKIIAMVEKIGGSVQHDR